jgi:hypothetical protein
VPTVLLCLLLGQADPWRVDGRSLYVWKEAEAGPELLKFCAEKRIARLYLLYSGKAAPAGFIRSARAAKIQVHAMHPGDMAEWLDLFPTKLDHRAILDWVRAVTLHNRTSAPEERFQGIHLDVEPHSTEGWKSHREKLAAGYVELLALVRKETDLVLSAAVPWNWESTVLDGKSLIERVQDVLDYVSVMAYRGTNAAKVLEAIDGEFGYRPGRVELILETDRKVVEEGTPLHVGTEAKMEALFRAARDKFGSRLMEAVHHYGTYKVLPAE